MRPPPRSAPPSMAQDSGNTDTASAPLSDSLTTEQFQQLLGNSLLQEAYDAFDHVVKRKNDLKLLSNIRMLTDASVAAEQIDDLEARALGQVQLINDLQTQFDDHKRFCGPVIENLVEKINRHEITIAEQAGEINRHEITIAEQAGEINRHEITIAEQAGEIKTLKEANAAQAETIAAQAGEIKTLKEKVENILETLRANNLNNPKK